MAPVLSLPVYQCRFVGAESRAVFRDWFLFTLSVPQVTESRLAEVSSDMIETDAPAAKPLILISVLSASIFKSFFISAF